MTTETTNATITIRNDFHSTEVRVIPAGGVLSARQMQRVRRELCGSAGCCCGGWRGRQEHEGQRFDLEQIDAEGTHRVTYR